MTTRFEPTYTTKQLNTRIRTIAKRVSSKYEHITAVDCVKHAYNASGDITLFTKLVIALLGPSERCQAGLSMIKWGRMYFPVTIVQEPGKALSITLKKGRSEGDWNFPDALAHPFDEASKEEAAAVIFDTEALLKIVTNFSNKENATTEAHDLAKTLVTEIEQAMGRVPEAASQVV